MRLSVVLLAVLFCVSSARSAIATTPDSTRTVAYVGGKIWDGTQFAERTLVVQDGVFVASSTRPDTTVDLDGAYVVPPFGDAHTHNLGAGGVSEIFARDLYAGQGIFYAVDLTNPYSEISELRAFDESEPPISIRGLFEKTGMLDVLYSNGGITSTGSHPSAAMERVFGDDEAPGGMERDAYWLIDSVEALEAQWPAFLAQQPDVVKVYLEEVERGLEKGDMRGHGLAPEVLRAVVERAEQAGKRVYAHVVTAADFRLAVDAGVEVLAHMLDYECAPGQDEAEYRLDPETIRRAAQQNVVVVTTVWTQVEDIPAILEPQQLQCALSFYRDTARSLHAAGVRLALGADDWRHTSMTEARLFEVYDYFDNATLLNLLAVTTPQAIFPNRKIGVLAEGYEASFLALGGDPVEDFGAVRDIRLRVKQGRRLGD